MYNYIYSGKNYRNSSKNFNREKNKSKAHKIVWIIIAFCFFFIPLIVMKSKPALDLTHCEVYIDTYYESINTTTVSVYLTFNRKVNNGYATISFYNSSGELLETKTELFYAYQKTEADSYFSVNGKVEYYELESYSFEVTNSIWLPIYYTYGSPYIIAFLIMSFLISYKEYDYDGNIISVYSGWYHHTLRINGELYDEHNTLFNYTPIILSTIFGEDIIEAKISLTNRIAVKVNNKLINKI